MKRVLAASLPVSLLIGAVWGQKDESEGGSHLVVYLLAMACVVGVGHFGGELVHGPSAETASGESREAAKPEKGEPDEALVARGAELLAENCAMCHYADAADTQIGPGLKGWFAAETLPVSGRPVTGETIRRQIADPVENMPAFPGLSESELAGRVAF